MPESEPKSPIQPGEGKEIAEGLSRHLKDQLEIDAALRESPPEREFPEKLDKPFDWETEKDMVLEKFWEADDETPLELIVEPHVGAYNDLQCLEILRQTRISPGEYRERVGAFPFLLPEKDDPQADWTNFLQQASTHLMLEELLDDPRIRREHDKRVENWKKDNPPPSARSPYGDINWGK